MTLTRRALLRTTGGLAIALPLVSTGCSLSDRSTTTGKAPPLIPETQVSLTDWTGLEITTRLVLEADPSLEALQSALVVTAEIPENPAGKLIGHTTVRMLGKAVAERPETGAIFRWSAINPSALLAPHTAGGPVLAVIDLVRPIRDGIRSMLRRWGY